MGESVAEYRQLAKVLRERANRYTDACETPWLCLASSRMRGSRERPGRTADTRSFPVLMTPRLERVAPLRIGYMHCFGCSPAQAPATHTGAFVILVMSRACVGTGRCWPRCTFASCRCTRGISYRRMAFPGERVDHRHSDDDSACLVREVERLASMCSPACSILGSGLWSMSGSKRQLPRVGGSRIAKRRPATKAV